MSHSEAQPHDDIDFPELHEGVLDEATLAEYFDDLSLVDVYEVLVKGAAQTYAGEERLTVETARELLREGAVRGMQIRYRWKGADWWDTLLRGRSGATRLVRVRHDW